METNTKLVYLHRDTDEGPDLISIYLNEEKAIQKCSELNEGDEFPHPYCVEERDIID